MTHHKHVEPVIGIIIGFIHWVTKFLEHFGAKIHFAELFYDCLTSVLYGLLGAFGAWLFGKIKDKFK